jgi:ankyrin repeat protein
LIAGGASANAAATGVTALRIAAAMGNAIMLKDLIAAGAPLNERDSQGRTALTLARSGKHAEAAKVLEAAGATE